MQFDKLFQLLARDDVKELALQSDRPPCVLIGEAYTPVLARNLSEDEVIAALVEAGGRTEVVGLVSDARRWLFDHPTLGSVRVSAGYHAGLLQARLRRSEHKSEGKAPKQTVAEKMSARPPEGPSTGTLELELPNGAKPATPNRPSTPRAPQQTSSQPAVPSVRAPQQSSPQPPVQAPLGRAPQQTLSQPAVRAPQQTSPQPPVQAAPAASAPVAGPKGSLENEKLGSKPDEIFESLLRLARTTSASDLHILADRHAMLRIGGDLVKVGPKLSPDVVEKMLMAQVPDRLHEELLRDGSVDYALAHRSLGRFRTNVSRQRTGMKLTARPISERVPTLADLGLPEAIGGATHHHQGLIVVTGPTGHGKTSTMAAIIDVINRERSDHIITVEDPIEFVHPRKKAVISQREVGTHTKKFANALKGSLREDPDVIAVGELRDTETVRMALSASETGHLVISTMNTPSAAKAIERLIDLFPPGDQPQVRMSLSGGLRMITSQRLVPSTDRKTVKAAVEVLPGSAPLWALIRDNKTFQIPSLQQRGKALGIVRLDDSLADLVRSGFTTLEIAREYADAPEQLEAVVRGTPARAPEGLPANDATAGATAQKFGKDMLSKAGKLFGGEK